MGNLQYWVLAGDDALPLPECRALSAGVPPDQAFTTAYTAGGCGWQPPCLCFDPERVRVSNPLWPGSVVPQ